ncbi:MAG: hypothetical protein ACXQS8_02880, partial [Candidatus Helarchaeales archaeon]
KGLFQMIMEAWPKRAFRLYEMEVMANARYVKWLKSLPLEEEGLVKDFGIEDEWMPLHKILKDRFEMRTMRWVFEPTRKVRHHKKRKSVKVAN